MSVEPLRVPVRIEGSWSADHSLFLRLRDPENGLSMYEIEIPADLIPDILAARITPDGPDGRLTIRAGIEHLGEQPEHGFLIVPSFLVSGKIGLSNIVRDQLAAGGWRFDDRFNTRFRLGLDWYRLDINRLATDDSPPVDDLLVDEVAYVKVGDIESGAEPSTIIRSSGPPKGKAGKSRRKPAAPAQRRSPDRSTGLPLHVTRKAAPAPRGKRSAR